MNQSNKKNEYEITKNSSNQIEISNNYPIVPLVNTQTIKLQNINDNDLLYTDNFKINWPPDVDYPTGISTVASVVGIILVASNPVTGSVLIITGILIPIIWPKEQEDPSKILWNSLMNYAEKLLVDKIAENNRKLASAEFMSLGRSLDEYNSAVEKWGKSPNNVNVKKILLDKFEFVYNMLLNRMAIFAPPGNEALLLSVYAQAANMHLMLIREAMIYANDWGLDEDYYHEQLLKYTEEYIEHCIRWYNKSKDELYTKLSNNDTKIITNVEKWKQFNDYLNLMTTTVLDVVSLFSNYDIYKYPVISKEKKVQIPSIELTRDLYTNPTGYTNKGLNNFTDTHRSMLQLELRLRPHLFTWLDHVSFLSHDITDEESYLVGNTNYYYYTEDSNNLHSLPYESTNIPLLENEFAVRKIFNIKNSAEFSDIHVSRIEPSLYDSPEITKIHFIDFFFENTPSIKYQYFTSTDNKLYNGNFKKLEYFGPNYYTTDKPRDRLSQIITYPLTRDLITSVFVWTHPSVDFRNTIYRDRITQIPAVKAYFISDINGQNGEVIKGPGHTGGDLVKLMPYSSVKFKFNFEDQKQRYKIRLRYATTEYTQIRIQLDSNYFFSILSKTKLTNEINLNYKVFDHQIVFENTENLTFTELTITSWGNDIIIDKLEFIPVI